MPDALPLVSVQIVVHNGRRFLRNCLNAVRAQTYSNLEVVIFDNSSDDGTPDIVSTEYSSYTIVRNDRNLGMWPAQELLMRRTRGVYILALSVDVILDPQFIANAVAACESDTRIDAVQAKIFQYDIERLENHGSFAQRTILDTCGFGMTRARKVLNIGHGASDDARHAKRREIFGVEGAAPFFRRSALEDCRVDGRLIDPDYFWYGDDLDVAWRMTLFGHRQMFIPEVVAWHDRSTTKGHADSPAEHVRRISIRRVIPLMKRRLDWSNVRFTIIKNDYIVNLLKDAPWILAREVATLIYAVFLEPRVLLEIVRFLRLLPRMLSQRREIMRKARVSPGLMHQWFT